MEDINFNLMNMEDFNLPSLERTDLLKRLEKAVGNVPPHCWAVCQVCEIEALKMFVKLGCDYPMVFRNYTDCIYTAIRYWGQSITGQSQPSTPKQVTPKKPIQSEQSQASTSEQKTPEKLNPLDLDATSITPPPKRQKTSGSPSVISRNRPAKDLARERDNSQCVLTGSSYIEVAHIYPFFSIKHPEENEYGKRHQFWSFLKMFWSNEKVASWERELFPEGLRGMGVEKVCNLITLSTDVHRMWSQGAFALKPLSESNDKMTLEVQFFWQIKQVDIQETISLSTKPLSTQGLDRDHRGFKGITKLYAMATDRKIQSGDTFKIQTDDPEKKPLPSFKLFELQWFLQRIQGMAGAAIDFDWPSFSDGSGSEIGEEIPELMLDEVGEINSESLSSPMRPVQHSNLLAYSKHHTGGTGEGAEIGDGEREEEY